MQFSKKVVFEYGFPGFLFSFIALPLFMVTPIIYESSNGLSLGLIGLILMIVRFSDAITDPIIGRLIDKTTNHRFLKWIIPSVITMALSFFCLMNPPDNSVSFFQTIIWFSGFLFLVSIANGAALLTYQSWVISITSSPKQQIRFVSSREMFTLFGVVFASYLATQGLYFEMSVVVLICCFFSVLFVFSLSSIKILPPKITSKSISFYDVFSKHTRVMFLVFGLNALANSIPALLFIFFVKDVLNLENEAAGLLLIAYFVSAIFSMPIWTGRINSHGPTLIWCFAILLSVAGFLGTLFLGTGDFLYFLIICVITGFCLGAELLCPPMILANKIDDLGHRGHLESSYFGVLNLFIKLSLAFASGTILPALSLYGYSTTEVSSKFSLTVLHFFYAGIPCILKLICVLGVYKFFLINKLSKDYDENIH